MIWLSQSHLLPLAGVTWTGGCRAWGTSALSWQRRRSRSTARTRSKRTRTSERKMHWHQVKNVNGRSRLNLSRILCIQQTETKIVSFQKLVHEKIWCVQKLLPAAIKLPDASKQRLFPLCKAQKRKVEFSQSLEVPFLSLFFVCTWRSANFQGLCANYPWYFKVHSQNKLKHGTVS